VKEAGGQVIFLRKVIEGGCDSSYGIHVAGMAGVPEPVVARAWEILAELERHGAAAPVPGAGGAPRGAGAQVPGGEAVREAGPDEDASQGRRAIAAARGRKAGVREPGMQVDLFSATHAAAAAENPLHRKAYEELMALDLNGMSPLQAMMKLHDLQQKLQGEKAPVG
jgi:DNA mismatch repair protein MutS